jgi:hypothetical protein
MSDLQDVIATNAIRAYNEGFARGIVSERERVIELLEPFTEHIDFCYINGELACYPDDCSCYDYEHAIRLIKGEPK